MDPSMLERKKQDCLELVWYFSEGIVWEVGLCAALVASHTTLSFMCTAPTNQRMSSCLK